MLPGPGGQQAAERQRRYSVANRTYARCQGRFEAPRGAAPLIWERFPQYCGELSQKRLPTAAVREGRPGDHLRFRRCPAGCRKNRLGGPGRGVLADSGRLFRQAWRVDRRRRGACWPGSGAADPGWPRTRMAACYRSSPRRCGTGRRCSPELIGRHGLPELRRGPASRPGAGPSDQGTPGAVTGRAIRVPGSAPATATWRPRRGGRDARDSNRAPTTG
jgi:hypothetical protein